MISTGSITLSPCQKDQRATVFKTLRCQRRHAESQHQFTLGAPRFPGGARLRFERRYSTFHGVLIEHGHEFTPENALEVPDIVTHEHEGRTYLERVWGTDFMLAFYNDLERKLPFADKAKPMLRVAYHGFRERWIRGGELVRLVLFLKRRGIPWRGIASSVLAPEEAVDRVLDGVDDDAWREMLEERRADDPAFADEIVAAVAALPPEEQAIIKARGGVAVGIPPTPSGPAPSATLGLFRDGREERAARERLGRTGITHVVFGHTHEVVDGALDGALFNPGTWVPSLDLRSPLVRAKAADGFTRELLSDPGLWTTDRRVVEIVPDAPHRSRVKLQPA